MDQNLINPLVSAIVPCYNSGSIILETIESLESQTYQNLEIIVSNDGSSDQETLDVLAQINERERVRVVHKQNGGSASARNFGIESAQGKYIFNLDADDLAEETYIAKGVEIMEANPKVGVVTAGIQTFGDMDIKWFPKGGDIKNFLVEDNAGSSSLFRKECWEQAGGYDEKVIQIEDWEFWINVLKHGWVVEVIYEYLFLYRKHEGAKTATSKFFKGRVTDMEYIIEKHLDVFRKYAHHSIWGREKQIADQIIRIKSLESQLESIRHRPSLFNRIRNMVSIFFRIKK